MSEQNLQSKIKYIIEQEKLANNSWKWIKKADGIVNELNILGACFLEGSGD